MAEATIRLGKISSINYKEGKARVIYEDRDQSVTSELPFLAWQYHMPKIDDLVVVACFSNGTVSGVILGSIFGLANKPYQGAKGLFRQEMSCTKNQAVLEYSEKTKTLLIRAPFVEFEGYCYEDKPFLTLEQINDVLAEAEQSKFDLTTLLDDTERTKEKPSLQKQIDQLEQRIRALGG